MEQWQIAKAIRQINPNAKFALNECEIVWQEGNEKIFTAEEIEVAWSSYQKEKENEAAAKANAKAAAQAKLAALGLTVEDLQALGL